MNPIVDYVRTLAKYGPPDWKYVPRSALYLVKLLAVEPLRWIERAGMRRRKEPGALPTPPIIVLGYYRSGTTHLQETLLADPRFGYMNFYQGFFSAIFLTTESWMKATCERIVKAVGLIHPAHQIPFSFELPAEEDVSMIASGFRLAANWGQTFTRSFQKIFTKVCLLEGISGEDESALKIELHDLFFRVSRANGHKRLVLKSPPQLGRVRMLLEMYPDAKFVFIRRNTFDVFASNRKLWKSFEQTWLQEVDADTVRENILWSYDRLHAAYERDKPLFRKGQISEITFEEFVDAPMKTLERVYEELDLGEFGSARPQLEAFLGASHEREGSRYVLPEADRRAIEGQLAPWLERYEYSDPASAIAPSSSATPSPTPGALEEASA